MNCGGHPQAYGNSSGNILGGYLDSTPGKGGTDSAHSIYFPIVRSPCQSDKFSVNSTTENGIPGVSSRHSDAALFDQGSLASLS